MGPSLFCKAVLVLQAPKIPSSSYMQFILHHCFIQGTVGDPERDGSHFSPHSSEHRVGAAERLCPNGPEVVRTSTALPLRIPVSSS